LETEIFTNKDLQYLDELKPQGWGDIIKPHQFYLSHSFCRTIKVVIDGKLAGIGTGIKHKNSSWLAHIIVHKNYRERGIGKCIVCELVSQLQSDMKINTISLMATDLGFPLYKKVGFREQTDYDFYMKPGDFSVDYQLSDSIVPYDNYMEEEVLQIDKNISGEERAGVLKEFLSEASIYRKSGEITGLYIPSLGDGFIGAVKETAGIELLKLKLQNCNKIVIPNENIAAGDFLESIGFIKKEKARRMILGDTFIWKPDCIFNRIGGNLG
jgi:ribosomal protein S18 acetylase RimI-like enzyme